MNNKLPFSKILLKSFDKLIEAIYPILKQNTKKLKNLTTNIFLLIIDYEDKKFDSTEELDIHIKKIEESVENLKIFISACLNFSENTQVQKELLQ